MLFFYDLINSLNCINTFIEQDGFKLFYFFEVWKSCLSNCLRIGKKKIHYPKCLTLGINLINCFSRLNIYFCYNTIISQLSGGGNNINNKKIHKTAAMG